MTPQQCRAARGLLDITLEQFSALAGVSYTCAMSFENGRDARPRQRALMRQAMEARGIQFIEGRHSGVMIAVESAA